MLTDQQKIILMERAIAQMAQSVHQAWHPEHPGTWKKCPKHICDLARQTLEEVAE